MISMLSFLFGHGYVFLTDMVCGPQAWCASPWLQRAVLVSIVPFAFGSMLLLARRTLPTRWALSAGALYALNPYVYERLLAGQWRVVLGYAVLPALVALVAEGWQRRDPVVLVMFSLAYGLVAAVSPHWGYIGGAFLATYCIVKLSSGNSSPTIGEVGRGILSDPLPPTPPVTGREGMRRWRWVAMLFAALIPAAVVYGLLSRWAGDTVGGVLSGVTEADFRAFATAADPRYGVWGNVVNLYGFWQDDLLLPKDFFPGWVLAGPLLALLALLGMVDRLRQRDALAVASLLVVPLALLFAVGYGSPWTEGVVRWLWTTVPGMAGLRDTHKAAGLVAFAYALYAPVGLRFLVMRGNAQEGAGVRGQSVRMGIGVVSLLLLAVVSSNGLLGDFHGQVVATPYPAEWTAAEEALRTDGVTGALVWPWQGYMAFSWTGGRAVANPARAFFAFPILTGGQSNPDFRLSSEGSPLDWTVYRLAQGFASLQDEAGFLRALGISHVVLLSVDGTVAPSFTDEAVCPTVYAGQGIRACRVGEM